MPSSARQTSFRALDGLRLRGTLVLPADVFGSATVLVHGGGVTRDEGGFFTRLADGLAGAGLPSLRFDFRGHGESDGRQEDLTIAGVVNDIRAAVEHVQAETGRVILRLDRGRVSAVDPVALSAVRDEPEWEAARALINVPPDPTACPVIDETLSPADAPTLGSWGPISQPG